MERIISLILIIITILPSTIMAQDWKPVAHYPGISTDGAFSFTINGVAYVGGGIAQTNMYAYDASTNSWTQKASVPSPGNLLAWAYSFSINGKGYVVGGTYDGNTALTDDTWEYDPVSNSWTQKMDFPGGPRDGGFGFAIGNKGYAGAGFDGAFLLNDFYEYDPAQDNWTQLSNYAPGPVIFPVSFVIGNLAYVGTGGLGGFTDNEVQEFWEFNPAGNTWTKKADFAGPKRQAAVGFSIGNKGYIGGGMTGYTTIRKDFWEYNPQSNTWQVMPDAEFPVDSCAWSTAFVLADTVYVGLGVDLPQFNFSSAFFKLGISTGVGIDPEKVTQLELSIFPNPAGNYIHIKATPEIHSGINIISILDIEGRHYSDYSFTGELNVQQLSPGIYFVKIVTEEETHYKKFIKL